MTAVLEFRGLDLQASGIKLHLTRGFLEPPVQRGTDYVVAAREGQMSGNRVADHVTMILEGWVAGSDAAAWRAATDDLLAVLDENGVDPGDLIVRAPYMGLATGAVATIAARVVNLLPGPIVALTKQSWSIELQSIDPYWVITNP